MGVWARALARGATTMAGDQTTAWRMPPPSCFGQKNNNQLATRATKVGGGRKESAGNHTATITGNDRSVHRMTEWGGGR